MSYVMMTNRITTERMLEELRQRMAEIEAAIMRLETEPALPDLTPAAMPDF
jgi:hypothetical protein